MRSVRSNTRRSSTTQSLSGTSANLLSVVAGTQQARSVDGVRVLQREGTLGIQYLVSLEDETRVWLPNECVADDLRSQYGLEWWNACRQGDQATLEKFLSTSSGTLLHSKDSKQRSPIHFLAGVGDTFVLDRLLKEGADVNAQDVDGYTAAHLAAGYMRLDSLRCLLSAGADAELEDNTGRSVQGLVQTLLSNTPVTTTTYSRRVALESMLSAIEAHIYEEIVPVALLSKRLSNGTAEYLVRWIDDVDDMWVPEGDIADDVIQTFEENLELTKGELLTQKEDESNGQRRLIQWHDSQILTWI